MTTNEPTDGVTTPQDAGRPTIGAERTLGEKIYRLIRERILSGQLAPLATVRDEQIAAATGASRPTARAALNCLAAEGVLERVPRRGFRVLATSLEELLDIDTVLQALAVRAGALAVPRGRRARRPAVLPVSGHRERQQSERTEAVSTARGLWRPESRAPLGLLGLLGLLLTSVLGLGSARAGAQERVDLLLRNGTVFTADAQLTRARAVVTRGGRILAVGGDELASRYRADRVVDLKGRLVTPGFIDTHIHVNPDPTWHVDLSHLESIEEIKRVLRAKAREVGPGRWVTGDGWAEGLVRERRALTRHDLDAAAPDTPILLWRAGGHSAVASSRALALAGITRDTPDPDGGVIEREASGDPSGIIRERMDLVGRLVPRAPAADLEASVVQKLQDLLGLGLTSIIIAGVPPGEYANLARIAATHRGRLPRMTVQIYPGLARGGATAAQAVERLAAFGKKTGDGDAWVRVGAVKLWLDGGFAGPAAWTTVPYRNQSTYVGIQNIDSTDLYALSRAAHARGWQLGYHAIGDAAIMLGANVLAQVVAELPRRDHRHYLNHFTVTPPAATMRTMAAANVHIAQQPNFTWAPTLESRYVDNLDGERLAHNNPLRTPMSYGIFMAFGSDNHPIGPMPGLYAAVTRRGSSGRVYAADERLSMPEAIVAYTRNGAYFTFEEAEKGTIEPGKLADMVVLSDDLLEVEPSRILGTRVDLTILDGRIVYERGAAPSAPAPSPTFPRRAPRRAPRPAR